MQITIKNINEIINYEYNARVHSTEQIDQLVKSMISFGVNDPIEIGADNVVISGHARLEAAKQMGLTQIEVIIHQHLTGHKREAYMLAANKIAMNSEWDYSMLKDRLTILPEDDRALTGFDTLEIKEILGQVNFEPAGLENQGQLDVLDPKWVEGPKCQHEFDARGQL